MHFLPVLNKSASMMNRNSATRNWLRDMINISIESFKIKFPRPCNVLLAIATNIPQRLKTGFVLQGHKCLILVLYKRVTLNFKLKPPVGVSKSLKSESLRLNRII